MNGRILEYFFVRLQGELKLELPQRGFSGFPRRFDDGHRLRQFSEIIRWHGTYGYGVDVVHLPDTRYNLLRCDAQGHVGHPQLVSLVFLVIPDYFGSDVVLIIRQMWSEYMGP